MTPRKRKNHRKKVAKVGRPRKSFALPVYDSIGQCAASAGIPRAVLKGAKRDGCPAFRSNRVYLAEFIDWFFKKTFGATEPPPGCSTWSDALNQERAIAEREARERRAGKLMETAEAKRQAKEALHFVFAGYDRMRRELPPLLKGCTEVEIATSLDKQFEAERKSSEQKFNAIGTTKTA